tara:strand:- start:560 stop:781 length:222 start_codon:yes stop_codon:yes gene_type:complete
MSLFNGNKFSNISTQNKKNMNWFFRRNTSSSVEIKEYDPMCDETIFLALGKHILETHEHNESLERRNVISPEK